MNKVERATKSEHAMYSGTRNDSATTHETQGPGTHGKTVTNSFIKPDVSSSTFTFPRSQTPSVKWEKRWPQLIKTVSIMLVEWGLIIKIMMDYRENTNICELKFISAMKVIFNLCSMLVNYAERHSLYFIELTSLIALWNQCIVRKLKIYKCLQSQCPLLGGQKEKLFILQIKTKQNTKTEKSKQSRFEIELNDILLHFFNGYCGSQKVF